MFGFLKKKISDAVKNLSGKAKEKAEQIDEQAEQPVQMEQATVEEIEPTKTSDVENLETVPEKSEPEQVAEVQEPENFQVQPEVAKVEEAPPKVEEEMKPEPTIEQEEIKTETILEDQEPAIEPEHHTEKKKHEKKSFFHRLTEKVVKKVAEKKLTEDDVAPILLNLESSLIEADVAVEVADKISRDLKLALVDKEIRRGKENEIIVDSFRNSMLEILDVPKIDFEKFLSEKKPVLIAFWGFNGAGKTTSLAKTASWLMKRGHTCVFAAADTFRAAAEEQLETHGHNLGVKVIKHKHGADPAAVIFDAVEHAKAKGIDFVLADTAGRAHTNANLMDQMKKIVRVNKPDLKILVIDSLTGNDAVIQARSYGEVGVDAVIFTKVDVNEKGGAILSVTHELKKPILFLGLGQNYSHFEEFDVQKFVDRVLA